MILTYKDGNALHEACLTPNSVLIHVCNNYRAMGAGIAKQIADTCPSALANYKLGSSDLGTITTNFGSDDPINVVNMVAQDNFCRSKSLNASHVYLDYSALTQCFSLLQSELIEEQIDTIVLPHKMGAFRAGGDWATIEDLIKTHLVPYFNITIVKYPEGSPNG